jgi:very-short-patch-repair endonuclease
LEDSFGFSDGHKTNPEIRVETILVELGEDYQYGYAVDGKIYDFYLPQRKLLLEVDGTYWHAKDLEFNEMDETQRAVWRNDLKKVDIAHRNGYNLVRIWEDEITKEKVINCTRMFL